MINYLLIGKIINTFGIKGEVKILSDFEYKKRIFKEGFTLYIGEEHHKEIVNTYRVHKNFDLLTFKGYTNINEILKYKGWNVYINKDDLMLDSNEYLLNDLVGLEVYDNNLLIGIVTSYEDNGGNILLKVKKDKYFYIPLVDEYIKEVNIKDRKIITNGGHNLIL